MSNNRRRTWLLLGGAFGLLALVGFNVIGYRSRSTSPKAPASTSTELESTPTTEDANVLVHIETTPPGAAMMRVPNQSIMGYSPETLQFRRSKDPVQIRFELNGYVTVTREFPTVTDGNYSVVLQAKPNE